jgi:fructan beta-fructosidase
MTEPVAPLYQEALRPQFHFTARYWDSYKLNPGPHEEGWINDVNGLVYLDGEYHLFAQRWWSCWLHAVSRDLVHWEELPPAFGKDEVFGGTQSGGAVVDWENASGLATGQTPVIVAFWSAVDNLRQCICYSNDRGRTWTKYAGNPVLVHGYRDPKVFWYAPQRKWVMVLYGPPDDAALPENCYLLFGSKDLLHWEKLPGEIPHMYECPDMFELPLDGDPANRRWVVVEGDGSYLVGSFDGERFQAETEKLTGDFGPSFYATMSWINIPPEDGRRIQLGWMRNGSYPNMPFNQQISFPCELSLRTLPEGVRLCRYPAAEIAQLYADRFSMADTTLRSGDNPLASAEGELFDIEMELDLCRSTCSAVVLDARGSLVSYVVKDQALDSCGVRTKLPPRDGRVHIRVLVDRMSVETFGNRGEVPITSCSQARASGVPLSLVALGGDAFVTALEVRTLGSAWTGEGRE